MGECLFCDIAQKTIPSAIVYEDELAVAFKDINPVASTHVLIVPRKHIATVDDLTDQDQQLVGHLFLVAQQIAREQQIVADGYRLVMNCNEGAGQSVFHIHLHLLGGRSFGWPPG